jgi:NADH-quinone oxidoreductase subunit G
VATSRPSSLDPNAALSVRFAPGGGEAFAVALDAALSRGDVDGPAAAAGADPTAVRKLATLLREAGEDIVIVWGERLTSAHPPTRGANAGRALLNLASRLGLAGRDGAGLLELPAGANGRGLREAGAVPSEGARDAPAIAAAAAAGDLTALYLLHADPVRSFRDRPAWEAGLEQASTIVAHAAFLTEGIREHATVVFPAESHAEKEGTIVHPDGRVQRMRRAIGRQGAIRAEWSVLAEIAKRLGLETGVLTSPMATQQLTAAVPWYAGLTLDEIGGLGVRWQERDAASTYPQADLGPFELESPAPAAEPNGQLRLGTFRSIWAAPEVEVSPALKFVHPRQRVEISPADAQRLKLFQGERVVVAANGTAVTATVTVRAGAPEGTVFLEEAIPGADNASVLEGPLVEVRKAR